MSNEGQRVKKEELFLFVKIKSSDSKGNERCERDVRRDYESEYYRMSKLVLHHGQQWLGLLNIKLRGLSGRSVESSSAKKHCFSVRT